MRRLRHKSKRREPLYWARACFTTSGSKTGDGGALDCESSEILCGFVAFDPVAAQLNSNEARVTVRSIRCAVDICVQGAASGTQTPYSVWAVAIKTERDPADLISASTTFETLLNGSFDILDVRFFPGRVGTAGAILDGNTVSGMTGGPFPTLDLHVQRILDVEERIIWVFGGFVHFGAALSAAHIISISVNGAISALWQRTLR